MTSKYVGVGVVCPPMELVDIVFKRDVEYSEYSSTLPSLHAYRFKARRNSWNSLNKGSDANSAAEGFLPPFSLAKLSLHFCS